MKVRIEKKKTYLVTGGSGFLGGALISRILDQGGSIVTVARNEGNLLKLQQKYPEIIIYTGDISDPFVVQSCLRNHEISGIFHLAAFKHVSMAEDHARQCTLSNINGSMNLLQSTIDNNIEFIIGVSTDKAAQIAGVYGASKYIMEKLFNEYEKTNSKCIYRVVRYGNVLYSTGSVLCKWRDLLKGGKEVIVTDPKATRYFWTITQAVDLIFECLANSENSYPYVPEMKSMSIENLLNAMANKYLPENAGLKIKTIGLQVGENRHEKITEDGPLSNEVEQFTVKEIQQLI
jgi:UDP-N-acetylglucosamine 4,6-dehydratase/5-epimerase